MSSTCFETKGPASGSLLLSFIIIIIIIILYTSPNIVRVIKSRRMRWAGHVASMDEERGV